MIISKDELVVVAEKWCLQIEKEVERRCEGKSSYAMGYEQGYQVGYEEGLKKVSLENSSLESVQYGEAIFDPTPTNIVFNFNISSPCKDNLGVIEEINKQPEEE